MGGSSLWNEVVSSAVWLSFFRRRWIDMCGFSLIGHHDAKSMEWEGGNEFVLSGDCSGLQVECSTIELDALWSLLTRQS